MAGAVSADVADYSANYYNPAGLANSEKLQLGLGWGYVHHDLQIGGFNSNVDGDHGFNSGLVVPNKINDVVFAFGLGFHLPDDRIARSRSLPSATPRWEFYDNRTQRVFIGVNFSLKPCSWLSLGAGLGFSSTSNMKLRLDGEINFSDPESASTLSSKTRITLDTRRYPIMGVQIMPMKDLSIGLTYRGEWGSDGGLDVEADANVSLKPFFESNIPIELLLSTFSVSTFVPHQFVLGASYSPFENLKVNVDLTYLMWSRYRSSLGNASVVFNVSIPDDLPPDIGSMINVPDVIPPSVEVPANFEDRLVPRLGLEYRAINHSDLELAIRGGYFFEITPVPVQTTSRSNLVDNDRHVLSLGLGLSLKDLKPLISGALRINANGSLGILPERTHRKGLVDPAGDYKSGGMIFTAGLDAELVFN